MIKLKFHTGDDNITSLKSLFNRLRSELRGVDKDNWTERSLSVTSLRIKDIFNLYVSQESIDELEYRIEPKNDHLIIIGLNPSTSEFLSEIGFRWENSSK